MVDLVKLANDFLQAKSGIGWYCARNALVDAVGGSRAGMQVLAELISTQAAEITTLKAKAREVPHVLRAVVNGCLIESELVNGQDCVVLHTNWARLTVRLRGKCSHPGFYDARHLTDTARWYLPETAKPTVRIPFEISRHFTDRDRGYLPEFDSGMEGG